MNILFLNLSSVIWTVWQCLIPITAAISSSGGKIVMGFKRIILDFACTNRIQTSWTVLFRKKMRAANTSLLVLTNIHNDEFFISPHGKSGKLLERLQLVAYPISAFHCRAHFEIFSSNSSSQEGFKFQVFCNKNLRD